jgi:hypothetical protein
MQIIDQHFREVPDVSDPTWDHCGSFCYESKVNQIAFWLRQQTIPVNKILLISKYSDNIDHINQSDADLVVLNFSDHPVAYFHTDFITKPMVVLHWDFSYASYHPYHLIYSNIVSQHDVVDLVNCRKYKVSCVNGKPRVSRIYNILKLTEYDFYNEVFVTWRQITETNPVPDWDFKEISIADISQDQWQKFRQLQTSLPDTPILTESLACSSIGPGFTDAYLNLVTESSCEADGFLTEKIYKPLRAGQLFIVQAPPGTIAYLRSLGFDVFDDYIDHSYDRILDWRGRVDASLEVLKQIYKDIEHIWHTTSDRRIHNRQLIESDTLIRRIPGVSINI